MWKKKVFPENQGPDCINLGTGVMERWEEGQATPGSGASEGMGSLALTGGHSQDSCVVAQPGAQGSSPVATSTVPALGTSPKGDLYGLRRAAAGAAFCSSQGVGNLCSVRVQGHQNCTKTSPKLCQNRTKAPLKLHQRHQWFMPRVVPRQGVFWEGDFSQPHLPCQGAPVAVPQGSTSPCQTKLIRFQA